MELHEFTNKVQKSWSSSLSRTVLQSVKARLEQSNLSELEVNEATFNEVLDVTNQEPTEGRLFFFIRIYDGNKSVDIQTRKNN